MFLAVCLALAVEKKKETCLKVAVEIVRKFYSSKCKMLSADAFVDMLRGFVPNVHYSVDALKIVDSHYINYSTSIIKK